MRKILIFLGIIGFEFSSFGMPGRTVVLRGRDTYEQQIEISKAFLDHSEQHVKDVNKLWWVFYNQYKRRSSSRLNISRLSSRARIHLFRKIILHKIDKLPNEAYWDEYDEDRYPTEFQVGNMIFEVTSKFYEEQPGNVIIRSCYWKDEYCESMTWEDVFDEISSIPESVLRDDPRYKPLKTEFYFMLDFEVARRLVNGDKYADLPIITYVPYLREHYRECRDFIVGERTYRTNSLFTGGQREEVARALTEKIGFTSPQSIRRSLDCLCGDDEQSDFEYVEASY